MSFLFVGGEDTSYASTNGLSTTTNGSYYRSNFSRMAAGVNGGNTGVPLGSYLTFPFTATQTIWAHGQVYPSTSGANTNGVLIAFNDSTGTARLVVRVGNGTNQYKVSTVTASGTFVDLATSATNVLNTGAVASVDFNITYSTTGSFTMYVNGVSVLTYSGDLTAASGLTTLGGISLSGISPYGTTWWSEIVVSTTSTLGLGLWTLAPAAAGATQGWTPNTVGNVNPTTINDSNFVSTTTANTISEWTTNSTVPSGTWSVLALAQEARVRVGATGPQHFEWILHVGGSDYTQGSVAPLTSFSNFTAAANNGIWTNNPSTGSAWITTNFGTGFNIGIESTT
jgi:hypothetical protein